MFVIYTGIGADTELPVHSMYLKQCSVWQNISDSLEKEPNVELKCMKNSECSGVDCIGKYMYEVSNYRLTQ